MKCCKSFSFLFLIILVTLSCGDERVSNPVSAEEVSSLLDTYSSQSLHQQQMLQEFYEIRDFAPAWNEKSHRESLLEEIPQAEEEGLFPEDYHYEQIRSLIEKNNSPVELELLLTDAFFEYAHDLYYGKTDPAQLNDIWGVKRKTLDFPQQLQSALKKGQVQNVLAAMKPSHEVYAGLKNALSTYRERMKNEEPHVEIPQGETLEPGKKDPRVAVIAQRLKQLGMLEKNYSSTDSIYDEDLQKAIRAFQKEKGLATDEILGNSTIKQLNMDDESRYWQIMANLERWRWYPRDLGAHYVLINIPNYKLVVVKNNKIMRSHNVIAGDVAHHTPIFSDSIQYIVINPQWNIPASIRDNEIIPQIEKNPNYLQSKNMFVTDAKGNRIDPGSVNWAEGEGKNYRIVQGPGASNSLGHLKIIYPNQYSIYLHDTPAKAIFDQNIRAESHGCVRVEEVIKLAAYLLKNQKEWNVKKIEEVIASGKTRQVEVTQPIKVHHFYWTAWEEEGKIVFINDIYELDTAIIAALKKD